MGIKKIDILLLIFVSLMIPFLIFLTNLNLLFICLVGLSIIIYLVNYYKNNKDVLNPDGVFGFIWFLGLGFSQLRLSSAQSQFDIKTWFILIGSYLCYILGSKTIKLATIVIDTKKSNETNNSKDYILDRKRMKRSIIFFFLVSFLSFILEVFKAGFIPVLSNNMNAYVNFGLPFIHYNTVAISIIIIMTFLFLILFGKDKILIIILFISSFQLISLVSRQVILFTVIGLIVIYHYFKKKIDLKLLLILVVVVILLFSFLGDSRNQSLDYLYNVAKIKPGIKKNYLMWIYLYGTMGFENIRSLVNTPFQHTIGQHTLRPIWALTRIVTLFNTSNNINYLTIKEFNVSTYLNEFYLDFGMYGILILPYFIGVVSKFIYIKAEKFNKNVNLYTLIYIFIVHNLIFAFFVNFYSNTSIIINMVFITLIYYFSLKKSIRIVDGKGSNDFC